MEINRTINGVVYPISLTQVLNDYIKKGILEIRRYFYRLFHQSFLKKNLSFPEIIESNS
jgi:hypothetical protein